MGPGPVGVRRACHHADDVPRGGFFASDIQTTGYADLSANKGARQLCGLVALSEQSVIIIIIVIVIVIVILQ